MMYDPHESSTHTLTDKWYTELEAHLGLGSSGSVVAGRVSYCFVRSPVPSQHPYTI